MPLYGFNQRRGQVLARIADQAGALANWTLRGPKPIQRGVFKNFVVLNSGLSHGGSVEVERIQRNSGDDGWERSGDTFTAYDLFLNNVDMIDAGVICTTVIYEGKDVIDGIYCTANDWLDA